MYPTFIFLLMVLGSRYKLREPKNYPFKRYSGKKLCCFAIKQVTSRPALQEMPCALQMGMIVIHVKFVGFEPEKLNANGNPKSVFLHFQAG